MSSPTRPVRKPGTKPNRLGVVKYFRTRNKGHYVDVVEEEDRFLVRYHNPAFYEFGCTITEMIMSDYEETAKEMGISSRDYCEESAFIAAEQYAKML